MSLGCETTIGTGIWWGYRPSSLSVSLLTLKAVSDHIPILIHSPDDDDGGSGLCITHQSGHLVVVKLWSLVVDVYGGDDHSSLRGPWDGSIVRGNHSEFVVMWKLSVIVQSPEIYTPSHLTLFYSAVIVCDWLQISQQYSTTGFDWDVAYPLVLMTPTCPWPVVNTVKVGSVTV